ncbi:Copine-8 [Trichoplax sp. H2]|nr:Copine-8 [Trichoplax sp. H2]|eukprot:RDD40595.1 Copine-8 [Trichoplax sp. H2]
MAASIPLSTAVPASEVSINVACRNLMDKDVFSKSDPMAVLYVQDINQQYRELGRTESIKDSLNPSFVKSFVMPYLFEECQRLRFEIYDVDSASAKLDRHDFLGRLDCTLAEILTNGGKIEKPLEATPKSKKSTITVTAEEVNPCNDLVTIEFRGKHLDKKDLFGKSDPFLVIHRMNADGSYVAVHKTEIIKNTLNPSWKKFTISAKKLCNADYTRSLKIECYDWDSDGSHDLIGICYIVLQEHRHQNFPVSFECINPKKKEKKKKYKNSGEIQITKLEILEQPSYLDFIRGGMQVNFTVGIDFTASNGDPRRANSLHYNVPGQENLYMKALKAVGEVCQEYDTDKMFPALGFGARLPNGVVSHEFYLNGTPDNPYCSTVDGVLNAYLMSINSVQLYGPTNFAPIINHVARFAATSHQNPGSSYCVLLMLTDGVISDMVQTKEAIVNASYLPLSIIIVGIGNADFAAMDVLDADDEPLLSRGRAAVRDIVQFVPFSKFLVNGAVTTLKFCSAR